jgi:hypothetical protein
MGDATTDHLTFNGVVLGVYELMELPAIVMPRDLLRQLFGVIIDG